MSFGFGFALPAYQLRGGGGNNPFNQNGPTLDLSFAGTVTDASNPNGYTLNTNFITPQYQIAAQYVIWETGVGLVDKTFSQIITFSRASGATWFNSAGNLIGVDFSTSSNTIGTGSKTFTLDATAGVNRSWATGDSVLIVDQANSANNMTGAVTSYTASTQTLVVNVTSTAGSGTITSWRIGNLMQRLDFNPATLAAQGLLIEEARTNSIRNNTMVGAVAGTPGTAPTNWAYGGISGGLATQVVGTGTENGITYIDIRIFGTNSSGSAVFPGVFFDTTTGIAGTTGQVWSESVYLSLAAGTGINFDLALHEADSGGVFLRSTTLAGTGGVPTTGALNTRRRAGSVTLGASTAFVRPVIATTVNNGTSVDFTLRIGLPQLEQGSTPTSVIPTTTTALTRSADAASVNTLSPWYNSTQGTLFGEFAVSGFAPSGAFPSTAVISDNTNNNRIGINSTNAGANLYPFAEIAAGGVTQAGFYGATGAAFGVGTVRKAAVAYASNDFAFTTQGLAAQTDTSGTVPTVDRLYLGVGPNGTNIFLNGWLRRVSYFPRRLSNAELVTLTT